jgi:hypothetical protein
MPRQLYALLTARSFRARAQNCATSLGVLFQKAPLYRGFTYSKKRLVTPNWIFPLCSPPRHQSTNNQDERPPMPIPPFSTVQSSFLHQTSIVSTLSEGRESNPTRCSGIGPHSRAMSSDLSRESRPILAGILRTDIIQKLLVKFDGVLLGLLT